MGGFARSSNPTELVRISGSLGVNHQKKLAGNSNKSSGGRRRNTPQQMVQSPKNTAGKHPTNIGASFRIPAMPPIINRKLRRNLPSTEDRLLRKDSIRSVSCTISATTFEA
jgi:hypothetical protein